MSTVLDAPVFKRESWKAYDESFKFLKERTLNHLEDIMLQEGRTDITPDDVRKAARLAAEEYLSQSI